MSEVSQFQYLADVPPHVPTRLHILLLADNQHPSHVVLDHIDAFKTLSKHRITVMNPRHDTPEKFSFRQFDAVLVHYSLSIIHDTYLSEQWRVYLRHYPGVKALCIEDEYQNISTYIASMQTLGFHVVFSALDSPATMEKVYGGPILSGAQFYSCLPGYVTEKMFDTRSPPIAGRPFDIVYRGRTLPAQLGRLAYEKRAIGEQMRLAAATHGLTVDISSDEESRIYGDAWPDFLTSGKAMLGVEGGASMFDFDGSLARAVDAYQELHPLAEFEEIWENVLKEHEGNVMFRTITPKFFEAIAAKTALVLYPGDYSGVLTAHTHYIPLERDGSNMEEVVSKLRDDDYLQTMVDRTFSDILGRKELHEQFYVGQIDAAIAAQFEARMTTKSPRYAMGSAYRQAWIKSQSICLRNFIYRGYRKALRLGKGAEKLLHGNAPHAATTGGRTRPGSAAPRWTAGKGPHAGDYDAVIMLTWSDWKTEPRSNRYHYATRFAKQVPVLFVQVNWREDPLKLTASGYRNIQLVDVSAPMNELACQEFLKLLRARNIRKPLLWIYNSVDYTMLLDALPNALRVYHATEDYLTDGKTWSFPRDTVIASIKALMPRIDLLVGVSQGVIDSYRKHADYEGPTLLAQNGCDASFFAGITRTTVYDPTQLNGKIAIYQGGINRRLDYPLLHKLVDLLPDWTFWFCGAEAADINAWNTLKKKKNVEYLGAMSPEAFGKKMCQATVGIIPFFHDELINNSLPLKAFEYVACGLPVVSVPIKALQPFSELFTFASTAETFAAAIESAAATRTDAQALAARHAAAHSNSYNARFQRVSETLTELYRTSRTQPKVLNIALLYDDRSTHVNTIWEHATAFRTYSKHHVYFIHATNTHSQAEHNPLDMYDVLIVHYSVRLSLKHHLNEGLAQQIERHRGLKILFIQDEYDTTETARCWMDRLQFDLVYTCVPQESLENVYPRARFPWTEFLPTLTGYVPEDTRIDSYATPLAKRPLHIAYRGRMLSYIYGSMGYEKYRIGVGVKKAAVAKGIPVDIEVDDSKRIYGTDWYRFLGSARATLGTESGSNVFDFDGSMQATIDTAMAKNPDWGFDQIFEHILAPHEQLVRMNQVSPKIFEAIRLRTALILFEGNYSGVIQPDLHYIPLKKDLSNLDDVFAKVNDLAYVQELTERAYTDIISSGAYSYQRFIEAVDQAIDTRVLHNAQYQIFECPVFALRRDGKILPMHLSHATSSGILKNDLHREQLMQLFKRPDDVPHIVSSIIPKTYLPAMQPRRLRKTMRRAMGGTLRIVKRGVRRTPPAYAAALWTWHKLPRTMQSRVLRLLYQTAR